MARAVAAPMAWHVLHGAVPAPPRVPLGLISCRLRALRSNHLLNICIHARRISHTAAESQRQHTMASCAAAVSNAPAARPGATWRRQAGKAVATAASARRRLSVVAQAAATATDRVKVGESGAAAGAVHSNSCSALVVPGAVLQGDRQAKLCDSHVLRHHALPAPPPPPPPTAACCPPLPAAAASTGTQAWRCLPLGWAPGRGATAADTGSRRSTSLKT